MHTPILQDPAEGSRDVVERELRRLERRRQSPKAASDDVLRLLGELSPDQAAAVLALQPSLADLELAALWDLGDGDITPRYEYLLTAKAAAITEIVQSSWDALEDER